MTPSEARESFPAIEPHAWSLDPTLTFLNHGSFGACPRPVLEQQRHWRDQLERSPVQFMQRRLPELLDRERRVVAQLTGADPDDIVFVNNATAGVNAVLRSLPDLAGGELLTTNHAYAACRNALDYIAARYGCRVVSAAVPFPLENRDQVLDAILARVSSNTRLALVDHVTSITGMVFPMTDIVRELEGRGIPVLVDGAHALGMLELRLDQLGASYYVANFHKWGCTPKGAGMLWVRRDRQPSLVPLVVSHGYTARQRRFQAMFDWQGTSDPTAVLCVSSALEFLGQLLPGGLPELYARNRRLALRARALLSDALSIEAATPESMVGSLSSLPLPLRTSRRRNCISGC